MNEQIIGHILVLSDRENAINIFYRPDEGLTFFNKRENGEWSVFKKYKLTKPTENLDHTISIVRGMHQKMLEDSVYPEIDTSYNGWSNRETWLVNLWLDECGFERTPQGLEEFKEYLEEKTEESGHMVSDFVRNQSINWDEVRQTYQSDISNNNKIGFDPEDPEALCKMVYENFLEKLKDGTFDPKEVLQPEVFDYTDEHEEKLLEYLVEKEWKEDNSTKPKMR